MTEALEYAAARFALATLQYTPLSIARPLASVWARVLDVASPRLRKTAQRNLQFALPDLDASVLTDGVFRSIGCVLLALARFPEIDASNISSWIRCEGGEHYEEAKRRGKGILFATAHLGNWELSAFAHALITEPMHVVVRPLDNPRIDRFVEARRRLSGNIIIEKKEGARAILKALARNEAVGVLIDQNVAPEEGVFIDFFGTPACAGTAFARIAHRSGAAVIPGFALWSETEQRHILHFDPIVETTGNAAADTARIQAAVERAIRRNPDQWLWIHRRWKTRPEGSAPLY